MTLEVKDSANYAPVVIRVPAPFALPNADRLVGLGVFGYTVITAKDGDIKEGDLAVFFPAESQLSPGLTSYANLYRHAELNRDPNEKGYLEDNRRVRALKLRGNISSGLVLPVSVVLSYINSTSKIGIESAFLSEGATFDHVNGLEISRKFRIKEPATARDRSAETVRKAFKRVDAALFPVHIETDQWLRNEHFVSQDEVLIVTQKLHGTSWRGTRTLVRNELNWKERLAKRLGVRVQERSFDVLAGSRQVIKDPKSETQNHYYKSDLWTEYLSRIEGVVPENVIVYGEIVGWTDDGAPIQKGHTYGEEKGNRTLYVYRVSIITDSGDLWDLSWDQIRYFCDTRGLKHVPELWRGFKKDFSLDLFKERDFHREYAEDQFFQDPITGDVPVPLSKDGTGADEGIAIRVERGGQVPLLFKFKNDSHYLYETAVLDAGEEDIESAES